MELVPVGLVNQIYLRCKFKGKKKTLSWRVYKLFEHDQKNRYKRLNIAD